MSQSIKLLAMIFTLVLLVGCNQGETLQTYFVDNQETPNFTSVDIPTSIVDFKKTELTPEQKEAFESINRLNFLGYKIKDSIDLTDYNTQLSKVSSILNDPKYNDLVEFNDKGGKVVFKYLGDDDEADEFILFGSSPDLGFGVLRVLGDDMSPQKMVALVDALRQAEVDQGQMQGVMDFFK
ncbi:DUF4252 domain-containing protein [Mangrovimonas sp. ST2L15]|uniref:DUF4252 domain-containing protein n=1 Tax=Mangrovimonas sp. ST2L15 TaxID=1645916 RepID=UPI0006B3F930|nr:DUF4252 domain-containing protein [Mangrovimonas sp. ST2L15]